MAVYFFDAARGSDSNNGTSAGSAFKSLKALDNIKLNPGDKVLLAAGQQFDGQLTVKGSGTAEKPIVVSSFGEGGKPVISGGEVGIYASKTAYLDISNIAITNTKGNAIYAGNAQNLKIDNIYVYNTGTEKAGSISLQSSQNVTIVNSKVEGVKNGDGIWVYKTDGVVIKDNHVLNATGHNSDAVQINSSQNIIVAGNRLDMSGETASAKGVLVLVEAKGAVVEGNVVKGGGFGIGAYGETIAIKGNDISGYGGYSWSYGIGLGAQVDAKNYKISDNYIHDGVWGVSVSSPSGDNVNRTGIEISGNLFDKLSNAALKVDREASVYFGDNSIGSSTKDVYVSDLVKATGKVTVVASDVTADVGAAFVALTAAKQVAVDLGLVKPAAAPIAVPSSPAAAAAPVVLVGKALVTDGKTVTATVGELEAYDSIHGSAKDAAAAISLVVKNGGVLHLGDELGSRAATITGSAEGNTITTGGGADRMIQTLDALNKGATTIFHGGAGIDTLELTAINGPLKSTVLADGSVAFTADGRTVVAGADVEALVINGSLENDDIGGGKGDDWLDGGRGSDTYRGSAGNDTYIFNSFGDRVVGEVAGGGIDTIQSSVSVNLNDHGAVENLIFTGKNTALVATGNALDNTIVGNKLDNVITGGKGIDQLWGKGGADIFHFAEMGAANKDTIWDFDANDKIRLDKGVFQGLDANKDGILDVGSLTLGAAAVGTKAQIVYNASTGDVSYDADGANGQPMQVIANIGKNLAFLDHTDFLIA